MLSIAGSNVVSAPQSISPPNDVDEGSGPLKKLNGEDDGWRIFELEVVDDGGAEEVWGGALGTAKVNCDCLSAMFSCWSRLRRSRKLLFSVWASSFLASRAASLSSNCVERKISTNHSCGDEKILTSLTCFSLRSRNALCAARFCSLRLSNLDSSCCYIGELESFCNIVVPFHT